MTGRLSSLSRTAQLALVFGCLLLVGVVGYLTLISPKRSTADDLKQETAAVQAQIERNRTDAFAKALPAVRSASVFSLTKAMPDDVAMSSVILELNQLALDTGITFDEITPQAPAADSAFDVEPIKVQFSGSFYNLSDFLLRLRNLVRVENGKLLARGRMFAVSDIGFSESDQNFPYVKAVMTVNAFVPTAAQPTPAADAAGTTTATTTTQTTTNSSQSASGAASGGSS
jgi:Tfp pilus assembly protein PilO